MIKSVKCGIAAAVVVAAGFAAFQSYGSYGAQDNSLLMQNIEALASGADGSDGDGGDYGSVPNGKVEIYSSVTKCHKLVKDPNQHQGEGDERVYWHYDDTKNAANCRIIDVKEYKGQKLCESWMLRNCSQYGGTPHEIPADLLGWY